MPNPQTANHCPIKLLIKSGLGVRIADMKVTFHLPSRSFKLVGWLFTVLRPAQEFFTYMETSPMLVKGCKI
jgi:hypothetical protein